jgi:hypothetical protein
MFAGYYYSNRYAILLVQETGNEYFQELALSPVEKGCRNRARWGRKRKSQAESITVTTSEAGEQKASTSPKTARNVKFKKHRGCPIENVWEKPARGRKGKNLVEQEVEETVEHLRKTKRMRKAISYAE